LYTGLQPGMDELVDRIAAKKAEIDLLRNLAPRGLSNLEHVHDLESPHTSNAIEGNTLWAAEIVLVVEQEIVIGGKPLMDHLGAVNHCDAIRDVRELARQGTSLSRNGLAHSAQLGSEAVGARDRRTIKAVLC
jgi:Fic family protein